ncbi:MAG: hypothetical protein IKT68_04595 [Clostridia bacterium]|nr:hypothetical protein [Clostridia bacterium]
MKKNKKGQANNQNKQYQFPTDAPFQQIKDPKTDPLGSYTGNPADGGAPVQDADDL